jgi:hypothetical protein
MRLQSPSSMSTLRKCWCLSPDQARECCSSPIRSSSTCRRLSRQPPTASRSVGAAGSVRTRRHTSRRKRDTRALGSIRAPFGYVSGRADPGVPRMRRARPRSAVRKTTSPSFFPQPCTVSSLVHIHTRHFACIASVRVKESTARVEQSRARASATGPPKPRRRLAGCEWRPKGT